MKSLILSSVLVLACGSVFASKPAKIETTKVEATKTVEAVKAPEATKIEDAAIAPEATKTEAAKVATAPAAKAKKINKK